jgi:anti-anti-sigma regulatory factor
MLKIVFDEMTDGIFNVRLEGRVVGPWVAELRRSCEAVLATGVRLALDLSDVWFMDRDGVELLRSLRCRDVVVLNCSPFVAEQLKTQER